MVDSWDIDQVLLHEEFIIGSHSNSPLILVGITSHNWSQSVRISPTLIGLMIHIGRQGIESFFLLWFL